jgi:hypothetical protein
VTGQLHAPAALPPVPIRYEARAPRRRSGRGGEGKKSRHCPCRELNPGHPARSLVCLLTELPGLTMIELVMAWKKVMAYFMVPF